MERADGHDLVIMVGPRVSSVESGVQVCEGGVYHSGRLFLLLPFCAAIVVGLSDLVLRQRGLVYVCMGRNEERVVEESLLNEKKNK